MRITFVAPTPNMSGGIRVIAIYADLLRQMGHEVTVVALRPHVPGLRETVKSWLLHRRGPERPPAWTHFDAMAAPLRLIDPPGPATDDEVPDGDVVIATWWETAFAVAQLSPAKGRKFYFVQGHEVFAPLPAHLSAGSYYLPLRKITITQWLADTMRESYGDTEVAVVPNSVDLDLFRAPPRGRQTQPTVGLIYGDGPVKGTDIALAALDRVRGRLPDLQVVAFGVAPPTDALPLPRDAAFHLRPAQKDIPGLYARCDVWVMASRSEGFALPVLEAMACGCPVVATRTGCAPDVIRPGRNGYLADIEDVAGLADGILRLLELSETDWRAMSAAARATVSGYTWADAARRFEAALTAP